MLSFPQRQKPRGKHWIYVRAKDVAEKGPVSTELFQGSVPVGHAHGARRPCARIVIETGLIAPGGNHDAVLGLVTTTESFNFLGLLRL